MESILIFGQIPYLLGIFLLIQLWMFVFNHFCPFLDKVPQLNRLNPRKSSLTNYGIHQVPSVSDFLAWQGSSDSSVQSQKECELSEDDNSFEIKIPSLATYKDTIVNLYRSIPLRFTSRLWGQVNEMELPIGLRIPLLGLYCWMFDCNVKEAINEDLKSYKNLQHFFKREIKSEVRPIDHSSQLVSPCDGKVLHYGKVDNSKVEQVKGVTYSLQTFLGPNSWNNPTIEGEGDALVHEVPDEDYHEKLGIKEGNCLYNCIIYLAPGDYHRFHSPADWSALHRRHFPGELFSVNPGIARWIHGLFNYNERVVVTGNWPHGYFSMTAVGATNVGSIHLYCDEKLRTNVDDDIRRDIYYDKRLDKGGEPVEMNKGACIGEFNLGSTIVLVFEAPKDFKFCVDPGDKIRLGEKLGSI